MPSTPGSKHIPHTSLQRKHSEGPENIERYLMKKLLSLFTWFCGPQAIEQHAAVTKKYDAKIDKILEEVGSARKDQASVQSVLDQHQNRLDIAVVDFMVLRERVESLKDTIHRLEESSVQSANQASRLAKAMGSFVKDISNITGTFITDCQNLERNMDSDKLQSITSFKADSATDDHGRDDASDDDEEAVIGYSTEIVDEL